MPQFSDTYKSAIIKVCEIVFYRKSFKTHKIYLLPGTISENTRQIGYFFLRTGRVKLRLFAPPTVIVFCVNYNVYT